MLRRWLQHVLPGAGPRPPNHLVKYSAASMANLLEHWLKQANGRDDDKYDRWIRNFWQTVGSTLAAQIDRLALRPEDVEALAEAHALLLHTLKTSFAHEPKNRHSIKFELDSPPADREPSVEPRPADPAVAERYHRDLNGSVQQVCWHYLEFARSKQVPKVISPLIGLLHAFDGAALWAGLAQRFGCSSARALYAGVLRGWLAGDAMRCRPALELVFMLMAHLAEHDQDAVFDTFQQVTAYLLRITLIVLKYPIRWCSQILLHQNKATWIETVINRLLSLVNRYRSLDTLGL